MQSKTNISAHFFMDLQLKNLITDQGFLKKLSKKEKAARNSGLMVKGLNNLKFESHVERMLTLFKYFSKINCKIP